MVYNLRSRSVSNEKIKCAGTRKQAPRKSNSKCQDSNEQNENHLSTQKSTATNEQVHISECSSCEQTAVQQDQPFEPQPKQAEQLPSNPTPQPIQPHPTTPPTDAPKEIKIPVLSPLQILSGDTVEEKTDTNGEKGEKEPLRRIKKCLYKRKKQNATLRKLLKPMSAVDILYNLSLDMEVTFMPHFGEAFPKGYTVIVDVDGKKHYGLATKKVIAKKLACEHALKAVIFDNLVRSMKQDVFEPMDLQDSKRDIMNGGRVAEKRSIWSKSEVPWSFLGSFAMHKLLMECKNEKLRLRSLPNSQNNLLSKRSALKQSQGIREKTKITDGNQQGENPGCSTTHSSNNERTDFSERKIQPPPSSESQQPPQQQEVPLVISNRTPQPGHSQQTTPRNVLLEKIEVLSPYPLQNQDVVTDKVTAVTERKRVKKEPLSKIRQFDGKICKNKFQRKRLNQMLRRLLKPRNAMNNLCKLIPGLTCTISNQLDNFSKDVFTATIHVEGKQYNGQGETKLIAKELACEEALKDVIFNKMIKPFHKDVSELIDHQESMGDKKNMPEGVDHTLHSNRVTENSCRSEEDVPLKYIASFALHKLFLECKNQKPQDPLLPNLQKGQFSKRSNLNKSKILKMKKSPKDLTKYNPVDLLNQLNLFCQYTEQTEGVDSNRTFSKKILIDGREYLGVAKTKKEANRRCATSALLDLGVLEKNE